MSKQCSAFEEMEQIIGKRSATKLMKLMPNRVIRIRKKHVRVVDEFLKRRRFLAMPLREVVEILGCSRRYVIRLRQKRRVQI